MALRINFNDAAAVTHTALVRNERALNKSLLRLSTGLRILSAADDSAGLFISDMLDTVAKAYDQGNRNIQTAISALQIAEASAGQIYDKLQDIYVRAQNAANDINDPNARASLQKEINNFIDAIQKIASDTEYNGIHLLDGTFSGKYIHYGVRAEQTIYIGIADIRAESIGAKMVTTEDQVPIVTSASGTIAASATGTPFTLDNGDYLKVNGAAILTNTSTTTYLVDAAKAAEEINDKLGAAGIQANAVNRSVADNQFTSLVSTTASSVTIDIKFYIGEAAVNKATFSLTGLSNNITLDELVNKINDAASVTGAPIRASNENGHLVLQTTEGETIAIEVKVTGDPNAQVNFDQLIQGGKQTKIDSTNDTAYAIKVGNLNIASSQNFVVQSKGVSGGTTDAPEGLALLKYDPSAGEYKIVDDSGANGATFDSQMFNLYAINVTTNAGAEKAMLIAQFAMQKVDTVRSQIGATMNNLQSIYDAQQTAYDNTKEAESVIRNTDYAKEMSNFTTYQIRMQSTIAMLAQANTLPQLVLQLLR
ncbi:MAG: flagellin [Thermodesulfobacteria bacterium]|nr:flagellin [Thermodesulfobacteriota bacterium]